MRADAARLAEGTQTCEWPGMPTIMTYPYPFEILATPGRITFMFEAESQVRRIFLDRQDPPAAGRPGPFLQRRFHRPLGRQHAGHRHHRVQHLPPRARPAPQRADAHGRAHHAGGPGHHPATRSPSPTPRRSPNRWCSACSIRAGRTGASANTPAPRTTAMRRMQSGQRSGGVVPSAGAQYGPSAVCTASSSRCRKVSPFSTCWRMAASAAAGHRCRMASRITLWSATADRSRSPR